MGFIIRWIIAFALLAATYNPTPWNFLRWSMANHDAHLWVVVLIGLILLTGHIIYLRATLQSIGIYGSALALAVVGTAVWLLSEQGLIDLDDHVANIWIVIICLSLVLSIGVSWERVRQRLAEDDYQDE